MKGFKSKLAGVGNLLLWEHELDCGKLYIFRTVHRTIHMGE